MRPRDNYDEKDIAYAKKKVKAKKEFFKHLIAFSIVMPFLFFINLLTSPFHWWFLYPLLGWGMGLAFHYVEVFGIPGFNILTKEWEEDELNKELRKIKTDRETERLELQPPSKLGEDDMELKELRKNYDESELV
ncbi:MAG: hypothetical protein Kow0027_11070 [Saprospiraceae bacterium]